MELARWFYDAVANQRDWDAAASATDRLRNSANLVRAERPIVGQPWESVND